MCNVVTMQYNEKSGNEGKGSMCYVFYFYFLLFFLVCVEQSFELYLG